MIYHAFLIGVFVIHTIVFGTIFFKKRRWYYPVLSFGFIFLVAYNVHRILDLEAEITNTWVAIRWTGITVCTLSGIFLLKDQMKALKVKLMMNPTTMQLFLRIILAYVKIKDKLRRIFNKSKGD